MTTNDHPTAEDQELLRLNQRDAKRLRVHSLPISWGAELGIHVGDAFGGNSLQKLPLPTSQSEMPELRLATLDGDPAFLFQRWSRAPIAKWECLGDLGVDSASICLMPTELVDDSEWSAQLLETEKTLTTSDEPWLATTFRDIPFTWINIHDDGIYDVYRALDAGGSAVAWVVHFGRIEQPDWAPPPPPEKLSAALLPFSKKQIKYAVAARRDPATGFPEVAKKLGLTKRHVALRREWDGVVLKELRIKEIEKNDYSFYENELARLPIERPHRLFKMFFVRPGQTKASKANWEMMLRICGALAASSNGILYWLDGDDLKLHDFGDANP